jgi:hypothetical protein
LAFTVAVTTLALERLLLRAPAVAGALAEENTNTAKMMAKGHAVAPNATAVALAVDVLGLGWVALGFAHLLLLRFSNQDGPGHCVFVLLVAWQVRAARRSLAAAPLGIAITAESPSLFFMCAFAGGQRRAFRWLCGPGARHRTAEARQGAAQPKQWENQY